MADTARRFSKGELMGAVVAALAVGFFVGSMVMELRQPAQPVSAVAQQGAAPGSGMGQDGHDHTAEQARIRDLEVALAQKPGDQAGWVELGNLYFDTHQALRSIAAYEKAVAIGPVSADVWTDLGIMHREAGQAKKALETFDAALKLDPGHENALYNRGVVQLHDLKDRAGAAASWERLVQAHPGAKNPEGKPVRDMIAELKKS